MNSVTLMNITERAFAFAFGKGYLEFFKGANSAFFFLTSASDVKKLNSSPSILRRRICGDPEGNNFNAGGHPLSIMGSFE